LTNGASIFRRSRSSSNIDRTSNNHFARLRESNRETDEIIKMIKIDGDGVGGGQTEV